MRTATWCILLCSLLASVACSQQSDSVVNARRDILLRDIAWLEDSIPLLRFDPPPIYAAWKAQIEKCSGVKRDGWPKFYIAPVLPLPKEWLGFFAASSQTVVFALGFERQDWTVRHELLHYVLDPLNLPDEHPAEYFGKGANFGKCGDLVNP